MLFWIPIKLILFIEDTIFEFESYVILDTYQTKKTEVKKMLKRL